MILLFDFSLKKINKEKKKINKENTDRQSVIEYFKEKYYNKYEKFAQKYNIIIQWSDVVEDDKRIYVIIHYMNDFPGFLNESGLRQDYDKFTCRKRKIKWDKWW